MPWTSNQFTLTRNGTELGGANSEDSNPGGNTQQHVYMRYYKTAIGNAARRDGGVPEDATITNYTIETASISNTNHALLDGRPRCALMEDTEIDFINNIDETVGFYDSGHNNMPASDDVWIITPNDDTDLFQRDFQEGLRSYLCFALGLVSMTKSEAESSITFTVVYNFEYTATAASNNLGWGEVSNSNQIFIESGDFTSTANPKTGFKFVRWEDSNGNVITTNQTLEVTIDRQNVSYIAVFEPETYTITLDNELAIYLKYSIGWYSDSEATKQITSINIPSKEGYDFAGYYASGNLQIVDKNGNIVGSNTYTTSNSSLISTWTPISYTISYNLAGGNLSSTNPTSYTIETTTFTLNNPSKTGYNFTGWTGSNGTTPQTTVTIGKGTIGNKSYIANWQAISYHIVCYSEGISVYEQDYTIEDEITLPILDSSYKEGYVFAGWIGSNGTTPQENVIIKGQIGDKSYTAVWSLKPIVMYDTIFSFLDWKRQGITADNKVTISDITETGFTITSNEDAGWDGYSSPSPLFNLAKQNSEVISEYIINVDVKQLAGTEDVNWQIFFFFYDEDGNAVNYSPEQNLNTGYNHIDINFDGAKITIPNGATKAKIRVDSNAAGNSFEFSNFRIYPAGYSYMKNSVSADERTDIDNWSFPINPQRNIIFQFIGWNDKIDGTGNFYDLNSEFTPGNENITLYSQWKKISYRAFLGNALIRPMFIQDKKVEKIFIYSPEENGSGTHIEI